jgi:transposase
MVLERDVYDEGQHRYHGGFLGFAKHCGFVIKLCQPVAQCVQGAVA